MRQALLSFEPFTGPWQTGQVRTTGKRAQRRAQQNEYYQRENTGGASFTPKDQSASSDDRWEIA